ncbi:hypothetical protein [Streptomyces atacamensis]|uniref:hypothetical protein n=1 Tax=Streptomyces atacamensis TaxID=531966 RepID=UPI00399C5166
MKGRPAAILALAQGEPTSAAARAAGVSTRTVDRWCTDPEFAADVQQARADMLTAAVGQLAAGAVEAVATLRRVMADPDAKDHARVQAARELLAALLPLREHVEIEQRLAAIEAAEEDRR